MVEIPRFGVGIDLVEIARAPGARRAGARRARDAALPAAASRSASSPRSPARCRPASCESVGPLEKALAFPGVERVETWIEPGETIRPVQTDGDRRGYVIASRRHEPRGARAGGGGRRPDRRADRMSCAFDLDHYRELLEAARPAATAGRRFDAEPQAGDLFLRHDVDLSLEAALDDGAARARARRARDVLPDAGERLLQPRLGARPRRDRASSATSATRSALHAVYPRAGAGRPLRCRRRLAQPRPRVRARAGERLRQRHAAAVVHEGQVPLGLEPALARRLPARGAPRRRVRVAAAAHPSGDLGLPRRDDGRDDARDARREARASSSATSPATGSTRDDDDPPQRVGLARAARA